MFFVFSKSIFSQYIHNPSILPTCFFISSFAQTVECFTCFLSKSFNPLGIGILLSSESIFNNSNSSLPLIFASSNTASDTLLLNLKGLAVDAIILKALEEVLGRPYKDVGANSLDSQHLMYHNIKLDLRYLKHCQIRSYP